VHTGIRRADLHNLTVEDVDYDDGFMRVTGKGNKDRIVPLGKIACRYLKNYLTAVRPELAKKHTGNRLFITQRGTLFSNGVMRRFMKVYAKKAGIRKRGNLGQANKGNTA
jgi:integrase/recombinase XerD